VSSADIVARQTVDFNEQTVFYGAFLKQVPKVAKHVFN